MQDVIGIKCFGKAVLLAVVSIGHMGRHWQVKGHAPVGQRSGKVALNVGVHDRLEVLEFAVLQEVDDMDLPKTNKIIIWK